MSDKIIIESTPGGLNRFYDLWIAASRTPGFTGLDMALPGSERTVLTCPSCSAVHLWGPWESAPKRCGCGLYFVWPKP